MADEKYTDLITGKPLEPWATQAMTDRTERKEPAETGGLVERLREVADPDGRIPIPILAGEGNRVGIARRTPEEILSVEAHVDEHGTVWMPPTAWAYFAVCRARDEAAAELVSLKQALGEAERLLREIVAGNFNCSPHQYYMAAQGRAEHALEAITKHRNANGGGNDGQG